MEALPTPIPSCPGCLQRDRRIAELEARVAGLEQKLEAALRGGKRQAAPFSKGPPKPGLRPAMPGHVRNLKR